MKFTVETVKRKNRLGLKSADFYLVAVLLIITAGLLAWIQFGVKKQGETVVIKVDGNVVKQLALKNDTEFDVSGYQGGTNHIVIQDNAVYMSVSDPSCFTISRLIRTLRKCRYLIPFAWHIMSFLRRVTLRPCTLVHLIILPVHFLDAVLQQIIMHDVWNKQYKQCNKQDHKPRLKRKYQCKKSSKC